MSGKKESSDETHGLSIVDTLTADTGEEKPNRCEEDGSLLKIKVDSEAATDHDGVCEEPEGEEIEEKINLFDILGDDLVKEHKYILQNSTLIITTEEHLDTAASCDPLNTNTETRKNDTSANSAAVEGPKKITPKPKSKNEDHAYFWVSNITRHIKATDLKKYFSQIGKVVTAKILTNGKNYFGYISVDSAETASKCITQLNNSFFNGKKLIVSKDRPDLRENRSVIKTESSIKRNDKVESKQTEKNVKPQANVEEKLEAKKSKSDNNVKLTDTAAELQKKLEKVKAEISRYKWKIVEYQRRHDGMRKKCNALETELKDVQFKMRTDRRKLNQDREQFEKTKKLDLVRIEADKAAVSKELAEVRKLREQLKDKIEEVKAQAKKNTKRRLSRSPSPRRSPALRSTPRGGYRADDRVEKKRKRDEQIRGRTPPPPPKLSNNCMGKKRSDNLPHRPFFEEINKRPVPLEHAHGYDFRHKSSFVQPQVVSRSVWQTSYPKDPRRLNGMPSNNQNFSTEPRYNASYQFPQSTITVPPRSYYPEFAKPYGHY